MRSERSSQHGWTRRGALAAGVAATQCGRPGALSADSNVMCVRAPAYTEGLFTLMRRILQETRLDVRGLHVVLKPNLVEFSPSAPINTHPKFVHAVLEAVRAGGAASVRIAEGPGHRRGTLDLAEAAGYFQEIPQFEDLFTDLNLDDLAETSIASPRSKLSSLYLPKTVRRCDLLISLPKLKTHHWAGATLSLKNLFGIVPGGVYGWPKNILHWAGIHECIADLHTMLPGRFAIVDGIVGMEGNGPIQGTPKQAGVIVAGRDMVAVDATCCRLMELDPAQIPYLGLLASQGWVREDRIRQIGEPWAKLASSFAVLPAFQPLKRSRKG
jgi:uncharacterized protein (DUF362 family)